MIEYVRSCDEFSVPYKIVIENSGKPGELKTIQKFEF